MDSEIRNYLAKLGAYGEALMAKPLAGPVRTAALQAMLIEGMLRRGPGRLGFPGLSPTDVERGQRILAARDESAATAARRALLAECLKRVRESATMAAALRRGGSKAKRKRTAP